VHWSDNFLNLSDLKLAVVYAKRAPQKIDRGGGGGV